LERRRGLENFGYTDFMYLAKTSSPALLLGKEKGAGKFLLTRFYNILQKTSSLTLLLRKEKGAGKLI